MKKLLLTICSILFISTLMVGQVIKEVDNGIFVAFPYTPEYAVNSNVTSFTSLTENCLFIVMVQRTIPDYDKYVLAKKNWTSAELKTIEDSFLDGAVKGKLEYTGNKGKVKEISKGPYSGREISYSAINPASGERGKRFATIILVRDRLLNFESFYLVDNKIAELEKNNFFNSIKVK